MQNNNYTQRESRESRSELPIIDEFVGEQVDVESATYEPEDTVKFGVVTDCAKLNVRKIPSATADIVCEIPKLTEVIISEKESVNDFYKICTESGIEGFCMKKYISVCQ